MYVPRELCSSMIARLGTFVQAAASSQIIGLSCHPGPVFLVTEGPRQEGISMYVPRELCSSMIARLCSFVQAAASSPIIGLSCRSNHQPRCPLTLDRMTLARCSLSLRCPCLLVALDVANGNGSNLISCQSITISGSQLWLYKTRTRPFYSVFDSVPNTFYTCCSAVHYAAHAAHTVTVSASANTGHHAIIH